MLPPMNVLRLAPRLLALLAAGGIAHALMLAAGVWSTGLFLAPIGLLCGLIIGPAQAWMRRGWGHPSPGWWRGAALGWGTFGLVASAMAWLSLQIALPAPSIVGVLAFALPSICAASVGAGWVQALFAGGREHTPIALWMTATFAVSALILVLGLRLEHPWLGVTVATPVWTSLTARALRA